MQISTGRKTIRDLHLLAPHRQTHTLTEPTIILSCAYCRILSTSCMCMCILHSLNSSWKHSWTEITPVYILKKWRFGIPWGLIFTRDAQVTFKLKVFIYARVHTTSFCVSIFFHQSAYPHRPLTVNGFPLKPPTWLCVICVHVVTCVPIKACIQNSNVDGMHKYVSIFCMGLLQRNRDCRMNPQIPREPNTPHTHTLGRGLRGVVPFSTVKERGRTQL